MRTAVPGSRVCVESSSEAPEYSGSGSTAGGASAAARDMSGRGPAEATTQEASAYFSEEEWRLLQEWQKELYGNVMQQIHQALISLGPLITTTVFTLRAKGKPDLCPAASQESERRHAIQSSGDAITNPDEVFHIKRDVNRHRNNPRDADRWPQSDCPSAEETVSASISNLEAEVRESSTNPKLEQSLVSFCINDELESYSCGHPGNKRIESFSIPTDDSFISPDALFSIRREENQHLDNLDNLQDLEGREKIDLHHPEEQAIISICIKEEDEPYSIDHEDNGKMESPGAGEQSMTRQQNVAEFIRCTKPTAQNKLSMRKGNMNVPQTSPRVTNTRNQLHSKRCWKEGGKGTVAWESVFSSSEHHGSYHARPQGLSQNYSDHANNLKSPLLLKKLSKLQENSISYSSATLDTNLSREGERTGEQKGKYSEVRPYSCTECEKSFLYKENLIKHYRTHTGEKPCTCTFCHKSFSRKDNLKRHMRMHTGEKPYRCTDCGKSFTWKESLNLHQRKHTREDAFLRNNTVKQKHL
ncbi:zinc finger protein 282-like isoform X2 [Pleurodeles waltl]|uniref:zinc finger protein 282-like isoform X2 n=1 Tax=Pleurodeles waltl TaxID=8319 RepID=UPI003709B323